MELVSVIAETHKYSMLKLDNVIVNMGIAVQVQESHVKHGALPVNNGMEIHAFVQQALLDIMVFAKNVHMNQPLTQLQQHASVLEIKYWIFINLYVLRVQPILSLSQIYHNVHAIADLLNQDQIVLRDVDLINNGLAQNVFVNRNM